MQYMILLYTEPYDAPQPGEAGFDDFMGPWVEFNQRLQEHGALVTGGELQSVETATTVRRAAPGADTIVDGPFAESKEVLGGFYVIDVADLDAALAAVAMLPLPAGSFEIRPLKPGPAG